MVLLVLIKSYSKVKRTRFHFGNRVVINDLMRPHLHGAPTANIGTDVNTKPASCDVTKLGSSDLILSSLFTL